MSARLDPDVEDAIRRRIKGGTVGGNQMAVDYVVVFRIMRPYGQEYRLPAVEQWSVAEDLAEALHAAYPEALIEISHGGIRTLVA